METQSEVYQPFLLPKAKKSHTQKTSLIRRISSMKPGGVQSSFCSLFSSTIGIGFLAIPYATAQCGLILGTFVLILRGLCFGVYYKALAQACDRTGIFSYVGVVDNLYGPRWRLFAETVIVASCFGLLSVMWVIALDITTSLFPSIESVWEEFALMVFFGLALELPLAIKPELASIRYAPAFSFLCIGFLALVVCVDIATTTPDLTGISLFSVNLKTIDSVILVLFAYDATMFIPIIFSEMAYSRHRSYGLMRQVLRRTNTMLIVCYLILGLGGFASHYPNVPELLVFPNSVESDWTGHIGKCLVLISVLTEMPLILNPARLTIQQAIGGPGFIHQPNIYRAATLSLIFLPIATALCFGREIVYFKLLGGISTVLHGFVLPSKSPIEPWCISRCIEACGRAGLWLGLRACSAG